MTELRDAIMTIANYLDQQAFERGMKQGMRQGFQAGRQEGALLILEGVRQRDLKTAQKMLHKGLDKTLVQEFMRLSDDKLKKLIEEN
jgi:predicted transposase YdaD